VLLSVYTTELRSTKAEAASGYAPLTAFDERNIATAVRAFVEVSHVYYSVLTRLF
jgi:hypothetical protein